ncbi:hypothetical protein [Salinarimonas rosea]|uniref:hypothetical protein n=1 Tax=Salinarimonas rosea TaxID=552063 RepID=UPI000427EF58|nr:hypothetical protein [Salinarimonas rosea]
MLIILGLMAMALEPALVYLLRPYLAYENGWDETTYLTYQGARAAAHHPVRFASGHVVTWLHELGVSGEIQNLVMDGLALLVGSALTFALVRRFAGPSAGLRAVWFGFIGLVLFNQSNPLLLGAFPNLRFEDTFWAVAWEGFHPFLRTPEPQLSLLWVALAVAALGRFRQPAILLLPVPLLYFPVAVGYGYVVGVFILWRGLERFGIGTAHPPVVRVLACNALVWLAGVSAFVAARLVVDFDEAGEFGLGALTHAPFLSVNLIWTIAAVGAALAAASPILDGTRRTRWIVAGVTVVLLQAFIALQQVLSGAAIHPTMLQSVVGTCGSAFALVLLLEAALLRATRPDARAAVAVGAAACSLWILVSHHSAQGLDLERGRYFIVINHDLPPEDLARLREASLTTIVPSPVLSGYVALMAPRALAPPFAHTYAYPWYLKACPEAVPALRAAAAYVEANRDDPRLTEWLPDLDRWMSDVLSVADTLSPEDLEGPPCTDVDPTREITIQPLDGDIFAWILR